MKKQDKQRIISRYDERLKKFGATINALASGSEDRRVMRFKVLADIGIKSGDSVLDLGCGFGDLLSFFIQNDCAVKYTGIDINSNLIGEAKKRFPESDFRVVDITSDHLEKFDFVVSTSCFNLKLLEEDNYEFVERLLKRCYEVSNKGVAIDFLTSYVDFKGNPEEAFYYDPERIFSIAKRISKRVCLRHDYPLFEFCVYVYPDFVGWRK